MRGRVFTGSDAGSAPKVCVISETFARRHFPGEDPIGRRIVFGFTESVPRTIVGVVGDVKRDGPGAASQPEMYVPFEQDPWWAAYLAIRTKGAGDPGALSAAIRREVAALDPSLPVADIQPMTAIVHDSVSQPRFRTTLLGLFGVTALLLAVIGIYGLIAYDVGRRAREIAIRLALGASRRDVLSLVFRQGFALTRHRPRRGCGRGGGVDALPVEPPLRNAPHRPGDLRGRGGPIACGGSSGVLDPGAPRAFRRPEPRPAKRVAAQARGAATHSRGPRRGASRRPCRAARGPSRSRGSGP